MSGKVSLPCIVDLHHLVQPHSGHVASRVFTGAQNWQYCQFCIAIYIYLLLYLQHVMLINMKLDITGCNRVTCQFKVADFISPFSF